MTDLAGLTQLSDTMYERINSTMMQHQPSPHRAQADGPTPEPSPVASTILRVVPREDTVIDLTDVSKQRALATELNHLFKSRNCTGGAYVEYLTALQRYELAELRQNNIVFTPELQIEVVRALSTNGAGSYRAEAIITRIAQTHTSLHPDALLALAEVSKAGHDLARSCAMNLSRFPRVPSGLFVGELGSTFGALIAERRGLRWHTDPLDLIKPCADFMSNRLRFVMNDDISIPLELRAQAFAETLLFLARDLSRGEGLRFNQAKRVLEKHALLETVDEVVKRCATSFVGLCKRIFRCGSLPYTRVRSLFPTVNRETLEHGFREAFMRKFASSPE